MQRLSVREGEVRQKRTQVQLKTRNCRNDEGRNSTRGRQTKAECVHNLGDIFNDANGTATSNLPNANNLPNQIRKIDIAVTARTATQQLAPGRDFQRTTLATSVSPPNLSFRDRYQ